MFLDTRLPVPLLDLTPEMKIRKGSQIRQKGAAHWFGCVKKIIIKGKLKGREREPAQKLQMRRPCRIINVRD